MVVEEVQIIMQLQMMVLMVVRVEVLLHNGEQPTLAEMEYMMLVKL